MDSANDFIFVKYTAGASATNDINFSLYSGLSDSMTNAEVVPIEYPIYNNLLSPVTLSILSIHAGRSYLPCSWKLKK